MPNTEAEPSEEGNEENYNSEMDAHHLMMAEEIRQDKGRHGAALKHLEDKRDAHQAAISRGKRHERVGKALKKAFNKDEGQESDTEAEDAKED